MMRGLYIHLPFCAVKCPYCSFYSATGTSYDEMERYLNVCLRSIDILDNKQFDTIYFGGGTPSHIPTKLLENFTNGLLRSVLYSGAEFTIEANPESVLDGFVSFVKDSAVTRVSLGVQSFDDDVLKKLGRIHNAERALMAANKLKKTGKALNLDMIFDIPDVAPDVILKTVRMIAELAPQHVSAYSYSSSDRGYLNGFDPDETMFEEVEDFLESQAIFKYETSNFALRGCESLHNSIYWTMGEYIGVGAGAHSMFYSGNDGSYVRASYPADITEYMSAPNVYAEYEVSDTECGVKEALILGLRMKCGADMQMIEKTFAKASINLIDCIGKLSGAGLVIWDGQRIKATKRGALVLEYLSSSLWAC